MPCVVWMFFCFLVYLLCDFFSQPLQNEKRKKKTPNVRSWRKKLNEIRKRKKLKRKYSRKKGVQLLSLRTVGFVVLYLFKPESHWQKLNYVEKERKSSSKERIIFSYSTTAPWRIALLHQLQDTAHASTLQLRQYSTAVEFSGHHLWIWLDTTDEAGTLQ